MINKVLMSGYDDSGNFPVAAIVPQFRGGLDRDTLRKRASIFDAEYDLFERKPKHTYIHLISVAAGEYYGPNSRADFYNGDSYEHEFPQPEKGRPSVIVLKGGLSATHNKTFMENGGAYTEHFSSLDGAEPQGYIVKAAINPEMHRGELIIGVETDKWADDIQMLESGTPMKFSIGASAPYDICSICGRVAHTEKEHCDHYKNMPGAVLADGSQVYVISDNCVFHDISRVKKPAEKIAFSIRKVASGDYSRFLKPIGPANPNVLRSLCKTASAVRRMDMLCKLAAIEKQITAECKGGVIDPILVKSFGRKSKSSGDIRELLKYGGEDQIIKACCNHDYILSPKEFVDLMLPEEDQRAYRVCGDDVAELVPGRITEILHSDYADNICNDTTYDEDVTCGATTDSVVGRYCEKQTPGGVVGALIDSIVNDVDLQNKPSRIIITVKTSRDCPTSTVADDYISYLLSAAQRVSSESLIATLLKNLL